MIAKSPSLTTPYERADYENAVVNSALWAAAGDALGWMTELSRDRSNVRHRTGRERVTEPVAWRRLIGGRSGVTVDLAAGTYSDDTQLRLCVSRSIRGDGAFDVETFAKIELTVWQGYSLGAGNGSKAAALNLSKRGVNWFSNFFNDDRQKYTNAGGNGAAMRIQPHVWSERASAENTFLDVVRDSIVTHGHPHGFGGALFHAMCLRDVIRNRSLPELRDAEGYIEAIRWLPKMIQGDSELSQFWMPSWEREAGTSLSAALNKFCDDALEDLALVPEVPSQGAEVAYIDFLEKTGCLGDRFRGSGFKTALAAFVLSRLFGVNRITEALTVAANEIRSDTDTIATMAGALLGAVANTPPTWPVQDRAYLEEEARRLAAIAFGDAQESFSYPDVSTWEAPSSQSDAVVRFDGGFALVGLGKARASGQEYRTGGFVWQWMDLPFGQSVLAKRRVGVDSVVDVGQMPGRYQAPKVSTMKEAGYGVQERLPLDPSPANDERASRGRPTDYHARVGGFPGVDKATDIVIASGFEDAVIGRMINQCIEDTGSIEQAISLTAIIAKARVARMKRR